MNYTRLRSYISKNKKYLIPTTFMAFSLLIHVICRNSAIFSDFLTFGLSAFIRAILSGVTSLIPFSLAETVIIMLPILLVYVFYLALRLKEPDTRIVKVLVMILCVMYALFVFSFAPAYSTTTVDKLFEIDASPISTEELYETAEILASEINSIVDDIDFEYGSFSRMNYDLDTLSMKLVDAYDRLGSKYSFIKNYNSRLKPIALSKPMTHTHISGVYTYYTGETNINTNFPDYTIPYTSAHEMAHARGFAREKEANFVAFLACEASNDPYVKYSGKLSMLEYITNALYSADSDLYYDIFYNLDIRVRCELAAFGDFFEEYKDSTASEISGTVNDIYLKSQGQSEGEKSYGLVVDLAVSYILSSR